MSKRNKKGSSPNYKKIKKTNKRKLRYSDRKQNKNEYMTFFHDLKQLTIRWCKSCEELLKDDADLSLYPWFIVNTHIIITELQQKLDDYLKNYIPHLTQYDWSSIKNCV